MPNFLRKTGRLFAIEWSQMLQYRFDIIMWTLSESAIPVVSMAVWYAVATEGNGNFSPQEAVTYYVIIIFVKLLTDTWHGFFIGWEILNGDIVKYLARPLPILWHYSINNIVEKSLKLALLLPLLGLVFFLAPHQFAPSVFSPTAWLLFLPSILLAIVLSFMLDTLFGFLGFWLEESQQIRAYKHVFEIVASGVLIPFAAMPSWLFRALSFLPFRYIVSVPAEILLGQVSPSQAFTLMGYQVVWTIGIVGVAQLMWVKGLQRYAIPGQ